jgi:glucose/arabinose dehydrogenase
MRKLALIVLISGLLSIVSLATAQTVPAAPPDGTNYGLERVTGSFNRPIYVTHAGDASGRIFIADQGGRIWVMVDGSLLADPFLDIRQIVNRGSNEQGLLGLAFHPDYESNGRFFIHYSDLPRGNTVIAEYAVSAENPNRANPEPQQIILQQEQPYPNHNGGEIAFGPDGFLYIGLGDGGSAGDPENRAQNPSTLLGKILRIDVDAGAPYAVPLDNPFVDNSAFAPEIWAWGLRNPWRFSFDRETGDLYIADVGQNQWEEVNFQPASSTGGENYGWRPYEASQVYSGEPLADAVAPFAEYSHALGCSITGGYVYRGEALPELNGIYLFADYCSGNVWASYRDASSVWQTNLFLQTGRTISSFGEDETGELYITDHGSGDILRLVAAS